MTTISRSALIMHSAETMFDIINDVGQYPSFLPWCESVDVIESSSDVLEAKLVLAKAGVKQAFTTRNTLVKPESMELVLVDGPFKQFKGIWNFKPLKEDACKVELNLEFEVTNKLTGFALEAVFSQVANTMVESFSARADQLNP